MPSSQDHTSAEKVAEPVIKKRQFGPHRQTRNQTCELSLRKTVLSRQRRESQEVDLQEDSTVIPEQTMTVTWRVPINAFPNINEHTITKLDIALGLYRYGSPENSKSVVVKPIGQSSQRHIKLDVFGKQIYTGHIQFRAPKTSGIFVFRLYDRTSSETAVETLGTSCRFVNELFDMDVTNMLIRANDGFLPNKMAADNLTALLQLKCTVEGMRNAGRFDILMHL
jgi:hypothetical protein